MAVESKSLPDNIYAKIKKYRNELLAFEMHIPTKHDSSDERCFFFKPMTELTAFIVNLRGNDVSVEVTFGYASTAFTRFTGCENALIERGVSNEDITIREKVIIRDEADEIIAKNKIDEMYKAYQYVKKDDLLVLAKEKRKAFIQQIHTRLKPLGFRKKANSWTYTIDDTFYLMFNAQKSDFSDTYYFNVYIGKNGTNDYGDCYYTRIAPEDMCPMDWQTLSKDDFYLFLDDSVVPELVKIISTPLTELGQQAFYWPDCLCDRKKCESCWMKKNLWESKQ